MNANRNGSFISAARDAGLRLRRLGMDTAASLRGGRLRRPAIVLASSVLAIGVLGFLAAPPLLRPLIEEKASAALGRQVSLGALRLNPFSFSASLRELRIAEAAGDEDFLRVDELYANLQLSSLWRGAPVLREIRVVKPQLRIVREGAGRYNFSDLLERFAAQPDEDAAKEPARFALYNIRLVDGDIRVEDKLEKQSHRVEGLQIGIPFIANLPGSVDVEVHPELRAVVNGSSFALTGEAKPFAAKREAELQLKLEGVDLVRYLDYVPGPLPLALKQGRFGADLRLRWSEAQEAGHGLALDGTLSLDQLQVDSAAGAPLLKLAQLRLQLARLEPLAQPLRAELARLEVVAPQLNLARDAEGRLNLPATAEASAKAAPTNAKPAPLPQLSIAELVLRDGRLAWRDEAAAGGFEGRYKDIALTLRNFDLAGQREAVLKFALAGEGGGAVGVEGTLKGTREAQLRARVDALPLGPYLPYLRQALVRGKLDGQFDAQATLQLRQGAGGPEFRVDGGQAKLSALALTDPDESKPFLQVARLELGGLAVDPQTRQIKLGSVRSEGGRLKLVRDAKGRFRPLRLFQREAAPTAVADTVAPEADAARPWNVALAEGGVADWDIALEDQGVTPPVRMQLRGIKLDLAGLSSLDRNLGKLRLSTAVNDKGAIELDGQLGLNPLRGELDVGLRAVDVLIAQPYVDDMWRVLITRGQLFAKGHGRFELGGDAPRIDYRGDLALRDFNSLDTLNDADFLRWKSLDLKGLDFRLQPLQVVAREINLNNFYTRLILDQEGRFNLRELRLRESAAMPPPAASAPAPATGKASVEVPPPPTPDFTLRIDRIVFDQGDVNYSDRFIKPNYDAHLLRVTGQVEGLGTDPAALARLDLKASLDGNAPVSVKGELNPFRQDRYLDVTGQVDDVDLTGVSAYSVKYVGYGITRGKLSMTIDYKIRDRQLTAQNQVFLDQLTFGERVDGPSVFDLPIKLGVALLKDSRGQIDLNLPISGSLDDPQFSVGGIVWRAIGNLFTRVLTSPFSLLGSLFGGNGEELAFVDFAPGRDLIDAKGEDKLRTLAKSLQERPALRLDVIGRADPAADVVGLKQVRLEARLRALKAERLVRRGQSVEAVDALEIAPAERAELLFDLYKREPFEKPRNALGFVRELPPAELEKALLDHTTITPEDLRALASRRAHGVHDWFLATGGVPPERVFLVAGESTDKAQQAPRVDFSLH